MNVHASKSLFPGGAWVVFTLRIAHKAYKHRCAVPSVNVVPLEPLGMGLFVNWFIDASDASSSPIFSSIAAICARASGFTTSSDVPSFPPMKN